MQNPEDMPKIQKAFPRGDFRAVASKEAADELIRSVSDGNTSIETLRMHSIYAVEPVRNHILEKIWDYPDLIRRWFQEI
jgi:hypothetical protein